ncbi:MAG: hypothetical protein IGR76_08820 [Synechococcales cyanobacterium T60_A2020_003]|nr:hypothetical protein [Synechococcales cyanobacterium T60_A2020_003]
MSESGDRPELLDPSLETDIQRLYELTIYARWVVVGLLWLTVGVWSLWTFRHDIQLMHQYFTWAAARFALEFNPLAAAGLGLCVGMTVAVLIVQSRTILFGLPASERQRLKQQALKIRQQGQSHPLWRWTQTVP